MTDTDRIDWLTADRLRDVHSYCYQHQECKSIRGAIDALVHEDGKGRKKAVRPQSDKAIRARDDK